MAAIDRLENRINAGGGKTVLKPIEIKSVFVAAATTEFGVSWHCGPLATIAKKYAEALISRIANSLKLHNNELPESVSLLSRSATAHPVPTAESPMIISHMHRFIFLRTEKTAGSSIEYALAELCGEGDIVTGIPVKMVRRLGLNTAWSKYLPVSAGFLRRRLPRHFGLHAHASAAQVKSLLPSSILNSYFKFTVERNPWDRQVSLYYQRVKRRSWRQTDFNQDMDSALYRALHYTRLRNWEIYTIRDDIVVDEVLRYEDLANGLARVARHLGLPRSPEIGFLRSGYRPNVSYREFYTPRTKRLIADWYPKEIAAFGYEF